MPVVWPTLLDLSRDECKRILRKLELEAYAGVISALRAQGDLTKEKKDLLGELSKVLSISTERHRAEVRRAVNDERLTTIAHNMSGPNSSSEKQPASQAIPQYAIPCHSSSNVVVEPSGLLELNNFTSQQLDDDETAMEQDIDSSTEDGTEPSPSQSAVERS